MKIMSEVNSDREQVKLSEPAAILPSFKGAVCSRAAYPEVLLTNERLWLRGKRPRLVIGKVAGSKSPGLRVKVPLGEMLNYAVQINLPLLTCTICRVYEQFFFFFIFFKVSLIRPGHPQ